MQIHKITPVKSEAFERKDGSASKFSSDPSSALTGPRRLLHYPRWHSLSCLNWAVHLLTHETAAGPKARHLVCTGAMAGEGPRLVKLLLGLPRRHF